MQNSSRLDQEAEYTANMKRQILRLLPVIAFLMMTNTSMLGYCCVDVGESTKDKVAGWLRSSAVVFSGKAIKLEKAPETQYTVRVAFSVDEIWKGSSSPVIVVETPMSSLHYDFELGAEYLVYAWGSPEGLSTGQCSGNSKRSDDFALEQLNYLGKGTAPEKK